MVIHILVLYHQHGNKHKSIQHIQHIYKYVIYQTLEHMKDLYYMEFLQYCLLYQISNDEMDIEYSYLWKLCLFRGKSEK